MSRIKPLIPIELLRRSSRRSCRIETQSSGCDIAVNIDPNPMDETRFASRIKSEIMTTISEELIPTKKIKLEPTTIEQSQSDKSVLHKDGFLSIKREELDLERTLLGGQSFRWIKHDRINANEHTTLFTGTIGNNVIQLWRCNNDQVAYNVLNTESDSIGAEIEATLEDYFQLRYKLSDLYDHWSSRDENFKKCSKLYPGFRILRQDPVENVFSFICATNNNIKRISLMINGFCRRFGQPLTPKKIGKKQDDQMIDSAFFAFPTVDRIAKDDVFEILRHELGFGYRAKFITASAKMVMSLVGTQGFTDARAYLENLRQKPYKETCQQLQMFPGIGRKVADCICLMSMDHLCSVPIDCHIYDIVCRDYMKTLRDERKTLTERVHDMIGEYFVDLHGPLAGWATSVLFIAELKHLKQDKAHMKTDKKANSKSSKKIDTD